MRWTTLRKSQEAPLGEQGPGDRIAAHRSSEQRRSATKDIARRRVIADVTGQKSAEGIVAKRPP
jgi:hypothetical protein